MGRLDRLRRSGHWEVGLVPVPARIEGFRGVLVVVDRESGLVRLAQGVVAQTTLDDLLRRAALEPASPSRPARPRSIRCGAPLRREIQAVAEALGATLRITDALTAFDAVMGSMLQHLGVPTLLPANPDAWRPAVAELLRERPWEHVSDGVRFRFSGDALPEGGLALVIGRAGQQRGIVYYASDADLDGFLAAVDRGSVDLALDFVCWSAHLEPLDQLPPDHVERATGLGLVGSGLALQLFALVPEGMRPLDAREEAACLAVVQGVLDAWRQHGPGLEVAPRETLASTALGPVLVRSTPPKRRGPPRPRAGPARSGSRPRGRVDLPPPTARTESRPEPAAIRMFDPDWRRHARWDGPPDTWPPASTVLLAFAEPLGLHPEIPVEGLQSALILASLVWSAVVLADVAGDPTSLQEIHTRLAGEPSGALARILIERKRALFAQDTRLMVVHDIQVRDGVANVQVTSSLPRPKGKR